MQQANDVKTSFKYSSRPHQAYIYMTRYVDSRNFWHYNNKPLYSYTHYTYIKRSLYSYLNTDWPWSKAIYNNYIMQAYQSNHHTCACRHVNTEQLLRNYYKINIIHDIERSTAKTIVYISREHCGHKWRHTFNIQRPRYVEQWSRSGFLHRWSYDKQGDRLSRDLMYATVSLEKTLNTLLTTIRICTSL
jgi:hypothetical protein